MSDDVLIKENDPDIVWYEDEIPVRGCELTLPQVKAVYRELALLTRKEGETIIRLLQKSDDMNDEDFKKRNEFLQNDAFRLTVSIVGFDGQTAYGESENVFDSKNLPFPIKTIFFTNTTAFRRNADGVDPKNRFSLWLHFYKPPLFDPNPLVSDQTPNYSKVEIRADDVGYFRAVQNIVGNKLRSNKKWYWFIHEKFAYDIGLWLLALPYALYWITVYSDYFFPPEGANASFRIAFYIYGLGLSLFAYRALFGYVKWAFPVNVLEENKDSATRHRVTLGAILSSLVISAVKSVLGNAVGL